MKSQTADLYREYVNKMQIIADVKFSNAVLQWDQETYLPLNGAEARGRQIATLSELAHELFSRESLGDLLRELSSRHDLSEQEKKNIELTSEDYLKNKKYSPAFVRKMSEQINKTFHSWLDARKKNDFRVMERDLDILIGLKREESQILGFENHPYDPHLNEYDKGATVTFIDSVFHTLQHDLKTFMDSYPWQNQPASPFAGRRFAKDKQWELGMELLKTMGFDFNSGRQDVSEHPFTISFHPADVRLTTRIDETDFSSMVWTCIHEGGHGLYEQGLPKEQYGLPLGEACSFSIHESQSRLWENCLGRSRAFCDYLLENLQRNFPGSVDDIDPDQFYRYVNRVEPSLIRTEADEVTYHFHVIIRYELEKKLIEGSLKTSEIPEFWNQAYKQWLGLDVPDDNRGCLQDVHWSHGSFGYFPTYTLGSLYAVHFFSAFEKEHPGWASLAGQGDFIDLKNWLSDKVFRWGKFYNSLELCNICSGEPFQMNQFPNYLAKKFKSITSNVYE